MTIIELYELDSGVRRTGQFILTAKHAGKSFNTGKCWWQEITLMDDTGEIKADVLLKGNVKIVRTEEIVLSEFELQPTAEGKKLLIYEWSKVTCTADELPQLPRQTTGPDWQAIGRGKVKHGLLCSVIQKEGLDIASDKGVLLHIAKLADWVMSEGDIYNG